MTRTSFVLHSRDHIVGPTFTAMVLCAGRIVTRQEDGQDVWIYGVEAGAVSAHGVDMDKAIQAFREAFTRTLRLLARDAATFERFRRSVLEMFSYVDASIERDWQMTADSEQVSRPHRPESAGRSTKWVRFVQVSEERDSGRVRRSEIAGASHAASPSAQPTTAQVVPSTR